MKKGIKKELGRSFLKKLRLAERDGYRCALCGKTEHDLRKLTIDHVVPASLGGTLAMQNCQLAHADCNQKKANAMDWRRIPDLYKNDERLGDCICKIVSSVKRGQTISYSEIAKILGVPELRNQIEVLIDAYIMNRICPPNLQTPWHRIVDDKGNMPRGLPDELRKRFKEKIIEEKIKNECKTI